MSILSLFSEDDPTLQVSEIAAMLELPRSTTYRYVAALRSHGLVEESPDGSGVRLGGRILELAATISRKPLRDLALPYMERVARETGETVILCALREHVELGDTYPLHAGATGKAIFAFLEAEKQEEIISDVGLPSFTSTTITDRRRLQRELATVRTRGFAESEGEAIEETRGIAVPIFAASGRILASIGASAPTYRVQGEARSHLIRILVDAGRKITRELKALGTR